MSKLRTYFSRHYPLLLSFWGPLVLMLGYFVYRQMYPFGKESLLTVDLGQQYVDFFQYYRQTILHDPSGFFYSFSKAIGGEMLGEWAYYMLSPFNLVLLFFPDKSIMAGVMVLTLLKYATAGYTFGRLLVQRQIQSGILVPVFATSYALMGWGIANQLNLLWLDALVFLPLIILGLLNLLDREHGVAYAWWLALMLVANYYMGYMIAIFLVLFFIYYEIAHFQNLKNSLRQFWLFASRSLLAGASAALVLLPTFFSLQASKGQYSQSVIHAKIEYNPLKILSKLTLGSFNFKQMPSGYPNIFVGSLVLFLFVTYFFSKRFSYRERICAFLISVFLVVSMFFEPLDLFWHGMQFPVWYPYRFSYLLSFWMIYLAAKTFVKPNFAPHYMLIWLAFFLEAGIILYTWDQLKKFSYATTTTLIFSALLAVIVLLILSIQPENRRASQQRNACLYIVVVTEMMLNAAFSLNNLSYLSVAEYSVPSAALQADSRKLKELDTGLYRTGQTYARTKNDGLAQGFNGGAYFSSALEKAIPDFFGQIGNPDGDNYVTYANGTLISDGLLDMKYYFHQKNDRNQSNDSHVDLDPLTESYNLKDYKPVADLNQTAIYQNPYATSLGYGANKALKQLKPFYNAPITYQTSWLNAVTGAWPTTAYFQAQNFSEVIFQNTNTATTLTGAKISRLDKSKNAQIIFKFIPKSDDPYYLTLGNGLSSDYVDFYLGNRKLNHYETFRHVVVLNVGNLQKDQEITITARLKKNNLYLNNFVLYSLDKQTVTAKLKQVQKQAWHIKKYNQRYLTGSVKILDNDQIFTTTIPYSKGWQAYVDGKQVNTYKVQDTFLAFDIGKGKHTVTLKYWPPYLNLGLALSLCAWMILLLLARSVHKF